MCPRSHRRNQGAGFPHPHKHILQRLGHVWALQLFEVLPHAQLSSNLHNPVNLAGIVIPTSQKRKNRGSQR